MTLSMGWHKLMAQIGVRFYSISDRADSTVLAIMFWDNQQKKQIKANSLDREHFSKCKSERTFSATLNKTAIYVISPCSSQNRIRELVLQKGREIPFLPVQRSIQRTCNLIAVVLAAVLH